MFNSCFKKRLKYLSLKTTGTNTKPYQPLRTIPTHTQTTQPNLAAGQNTTTNIQASPKYMLQGLSEKLSGILKPFDVKIASCNVNNLSCFFKPTKDRISKLDTADVVYKFPCKECTATYIGTTKRPIKTRIHEHKRDVYNPPDE